MTFSEALSTQSPLVVPFFDEDSSTFTYVVKDPESSSCAIIDSVLDFDYASGATGYKSADRVIDYVQANNLKVEWLLETHVHADHLSAAPYVQEKLGGQLAIGKCITTVQETFGKIFNEGTQFARDGSQFDCLFDDGQTFNVGRLQARVLHTPGHTPACLTYVIGDAAFVGDTLFMPDAGTARADFPGGDAGVLYDSVQRILTLADETRIFVCHDYQPHGRTLQYETTVAQQRKNNIHVGESTSRVEFVAMRKSRDKTLGMPRLILPSLQVNMRAGHFPRPDTNDLSYLKIPINAFKE